MSRLEFPFREIDSDESLSRLAYSLGSRYTNHTIQIPARHGSGIIRKTKLEEGLHIRAWDFKLNKLFVFDKKPTGADTARIFHVVYLIDPEALLLKIKGVEKEFRVQKGMNTIFVSNDMDMEAEISTTAGMQAVDISFSSRWLLRSFADAEGPLRAFINRLLKSATPAVFFESTSPPEYRRMTGVHSSVLAPGRDFLRIKAGALYLLSGFLGKIFGKSANEITENKFCFYDKMVETEKLLEAHLQKKFPGIDAIARQLALSESTLKRHLKSMFGKGLHEYYLELKMDLARRILLEKPLSVHEVAYMLDYEKVSSFIVMFKRRHGVSPGALRRKLSLTTL